MVVHKPRLRKQNSRSSQLGPPNQVQVSRHFLKVFKCFLQLKITYLIFFLNCLMAKSDNININSSGIWFGKKCTKISNIILTLTCLLARRFFRAV